MHYRTNTLFDTSSAQSPPPLSSTSTSQEVTPTTTNNSRSVNDTHGGDRNLLTTVRRNRSSNSNSKHPSGTSSSAGSGGLLIDSGGGGTGDTVVVPLALPGRPRRKRVVNARRRRSTNHYSRIIIMMQNFLRQQWMTMNNSSNTQVDVSLCIAILLWFSLGVFSIASSKILLTGGNSTTMIRVNPLSLTLQQLMIGVSLLRFFLSVGFMNTSGIKPWPPSKAAATAATTGDMKGSTNHLILSSLCFAFGFLATNYAFSGSAASFVETVKAAEPITSATVASMYGIETITTQQTLSLGTIIAGVLLSTLGGSSGGASQQQSMIETLRACMIVMTANLCFSYRGLYQKLFRKHPMSHSYDDLNLQYRMQYYGVLLLSVPTFLFDVMPYLLREVLLPKETTGSTVTDHHLAEIMASDVLTRYVLLSLFNGAAFTCYNLASTWILSRISVVHHAALNCIRRVFAVIVTSIYFGVPITLMGAIGISLAVIGFMSYTHFKVIQQQQQHSVLAAVPPTQSRNKQHTLLPMNINDIHRDTR